MDNASNKSKKHYLLWPIITVVFIVAFTTVYYLARVYQTQRKVNSILVMNAAQLNKAFAAEKDAPLSGYNVYVLAAFAQNQNAPALMLDEIARMDNPRLVERLTTVFSGLKGDNKDAVSIKRLVARNPNTAPVTLAYLAESTNPALLCEIAKNKKAFILTLEKLADSDNPAIRHCVSENPKTPQSLLRKLKNLPDARVDALGKGAEIAG